MKTQAVLFFTILTLVEIAWTGDKAGCHDKPTEVTQATKDWTTSSPYRLAREDEYELMYGPQIFENWVRDPAADPDQSQPKEKSMPIKFERGHF